MIYDALTIAEYIIYFANLKKSPISNLKLQKILYFNQAEFLVMKGVPCFNDEIEAWDFGPVVPKVYRKYKIYGSGDIPSDISISFSILEEDKKMINEMTELCLKYTASALVEITHHQDPWLNNFEKNGCNVITNDEIKTVI